MLSQSVLSPKCFNVLMSFKWDRCLWGLSFLFYTASSLSISSYEIQFLIVNVFDVLILSRALWGSVSEAVCWYDWISWNQIIIRDVVAFMWVPDCKWLIPVALVRCVVKCVLQQKQSCTPVTSCAQPLLAEKKNCGDPKRVFTLVSKVSNKPRKSR